MRLIGLLGVALAMLVLLACGAQQPEEHDGDPALRQQVLELQAAVDSLTQRVEELQQGTAADATLEAMQTLISQLYARIQTLEQANGIAAEGPGTRDCGDGLGEHASIVRDDYYVRGIQVC